MTMRAAALGAFSGLAAGLVAGAILHILWVLPALSLLIARPPSPDAGWTVHGLISAAAGALFGIIVESMEHKTRSRLIVAGLVAGAAVFVLGPLVLVPLAIGLGPQFPFIMKWLPVGAAYLVFGALMGAIHYAALGRPAERRV
ncbi:MAG: hypothetical protein ACM3WU_11540 [Bacillota bacterium]